MSWSRIDSGFWRHPKFSGWTANQKWALGELIGYCCEYRTDGHIPDDLSLLPRSTTKAFLQLATETGWLEHDDHGGLRFHDWNEYHPKDPTSAMRMRKLRQKRTVTLPSLDRHQTVTTNTSTKKKDQRPLGGVNEQSRPLRAVEEAQDGLDERSSENNRPGHDAQGTKPDVIDEAEVRRVRTVVQERFGA